MEGYNTNLWLRDDCHDLYHEIINVNDCCTVDGDRIKGKVKRNGATCVTKRGRLIRFGLTQSLGVVRRYYHHPDQDHKVMPLFLEFGVHEGKDIARIASFLAVQRSMTSFTTTAGAKKMTKKENIITDQNNASDSDDRACKIEPSMRTLVDNSRSGISTANQKNVTASRTIDLLQQQHEKRPSLDLLRVHGFDSFEGLPEDWHNGQYYDDANDEGGIRKCVYKAGTFDLDGQSPQLSKLQTSMSFWKGQTIHSIPSSSASRPSKGSSSSSDGYGGDSNNDNDKTLRDSRFHSTSTRLPLHDFIRFHKGWFEATVPEFFAHDNNRKPIAFVHADADLYSSTMAFLKIICDYKLFVKGSIIIFDEYWNYENWQHQGEYQAWVEIVEQYALKYKYIGYHGPSSLPLSPVSSSPSSSSSSMHLENMISNVKSVTTTKRLNSHGYQSVCIMITKDMK